MRARFERYLSMPANLGDYENYRSILAEIEAQLAANNDNLTLENIKYAWSRLFDAAEYQIDGDSSLVIANLVYLSWRMRDEYENFKSAENEKEHAEIWFKELDGKSGIYGVRLRQNEAAYFKAGPKFAVKPDCRNGRLGV